MTAERPSCSVVQRLGRLQFAILFIGSWMSLCLADAVTGQVSPEEHAKHHKKKGDPQRKAEPDKNGGTMGGMMDQMMEKMGAPKPRDLYPSLMALPDLPPEKRAEIEGLAHERMKRGTALMSEGLERLARSAAGSDFRAMESATATLREGLSRFDSGLAAHRALLEGKVPRSVALDWFRREMNLPPSQGDVGWSSYRSSWFHTVVMAALIAFAGAMIGMYFFKMRRAAALIAQLSESGAPAPFVAPSTDSSASPEGSPLPAIQSAKKWTGKLRVAAIFRETPDVLTFRLVDPTGGPRPFTYSAGQFLTLSVPIGQETVRRSYTIASSPTLQFALEITVKRESEGLVSRHLHDAVGVGDELSISAPGGHFTFTGQEHDGIVLIAGGVGVTPMMSVIRYLTDRAWAGDIDLLYCCRTIEDVIFRRELEHLAERHTNLRVTTILSRPDDEGWRGPSGRITKELIQQRVPDIRMRRVHVCGPRPMMDAVKEMLEALAVPRDLVKTEAFGAAKRAEATPGDTSAPELPAYNVSFSTSGKTAPIRPDQTVLDVADELDVDIDNSCRSGTCGSCKVRLLSGQVTMEIEDSLDLDEKEQGIVLACQARALTDLMIEA